MRTIFIFMITFDSHKNLVGEGEDNGVIPLFIDKKNETQQGTKSPSKWRSHDQIKPSESRIRPLSIILHRLPMSFFSLEPWRLSRFCFSYG